VKGVRAQGTLRGRGALAIVWLDRPAARDAAVLGGKGAGLCRLADACAGLPGCSVPPGFAVTAGSVPQPAAIAAAYADLGRRCGEAQPAVAVRSSAVDEDGGVASFAGQHDTLLNVRGAGAVWEAVEACRASAASARALEYRRRHGLGAAQVAVVVQAFVVADAAAVAFSVDPVSGEREALVINAVWGLGESLVGGTATPDVYHVRRGDPSAVTVRLGDKARMTVARPDGGTAEVDTPPFLRRRPALEPGEAAQVARAVLTLEGAWGRDVDVECAFRGGRLFLLQCRPVTALAGPAAGVRG
jgi:phosphoenolpyruvate synthase/pyruvate phosphate dikinase